MMEIEFRLPPAEPAGWRVRIMRLRVLLDGNFSPANQPEDDDLWRRYEFQSVRRGAEFAELMKRAGIELRVPT